MKIITGNNSGGAIVTVPAGAKEIAFANHDAGATAIVEITIKSITNQLSYVYPEQELSFDLSNYNYPEMECDCSALTGFFQFIAIY